LVFLQFSFLTFEIHFSFFLTRWQSPKRFCFVDLFSYCTFMFMGTIVFWRK